MIRDNFWKHVAFSLEGEDMSGYLLPLYFQVHLVSFLLQGPFPFSVLMCIMGFRPNCFTCIAYLYLYYTLLVPHTYASYIRYWCIFFHYEIQNNLSVFLTWYQSHCSDFFFAVLSSLVLFQTHNCFRLYNCCCNHSPLNLWCVSVIVSCSGLVAAVI